MKLKDAKYFGIKLSPHRIKNDKGQLIVTGCEFARTGKQKYHSSELGIKDKDEFIYLDRPVEEVSDPKTVASFEGAPVTLDHPEDDVKVGINYDQLAKGFAKDVKYVAVNDKEGYLQADFVFTDADLIKKIENNEINELSAGYNCDVDEKDWIQRHIRGNHIAVVEQARAGHQARLLDKKYKSTSKSQKTLKIGDSVVKIVDSYSYELEEADGTKVRYTDYYTEGSTGKKKYVTTLKDDDWDDLRKIKNYPEKKVLEALKSIIPAKRYNEIKDNFKWADIRTLTKAEREKLFKKLDTVKDSKVKDSDKIYTIAGVEYILTKDGYGNYKLDEKKSKNRVADWDSYKEAMKDINKWIKQNKIDDSKVKDSIDSEEEDIYTRRKEIDKNLREVFKDKFFDVEGFVNGNDSTEGSIYVVYYNPYKDSDAVEYANEHLDEDYNDEEFLDCASEFIEDNIERILRDTYNMIGENGPIDSIDVAPIDWSGEEEYPINFHIYCNGVTK